MNNLKKTYNILLGATIVLVAITIYLKRNGLDFPIIIPTVYVILCYILRYRELNKIRKRVIELIEKDYPDLAQKLSSKLFEYNLGINLDRVYKMISLGPHTGYKEIDEEIKKYKIANTKLSMMYLASSIVAFITIIV